MKKILTLCTFFITCNLICASKLNWDDCDTIPLSIVETNPKENGTSKPSRIPAFNVSTLTVMYNSTNNTLLITSNASCEIEVSLVDEQNTVVLREDIQLMTGVASVVPLPWTAPGTYIINIRRNNTLYSGVISKV